MQVLPLDRVGYCSDEMFKRVNASGARVFGPAEAGDLGLLTDMEGKPAFYEFDVDDAVACNVRMNLGDILIHRGDVIHRTDVPKPGGVDRLGLSFRVGSKDSVVQHVLDWKNLTCSGLGSFVAGTASGFVKAKCPERPGETCTLQEFMEFDSKQEKLRTLSREWLNRHAIDLQIQQRFAAICTKEASEYSPEDFALLKQADRAFANIVPKGHKREVSQTTKKWWSGRPIDH